MGTVMEPKRTITCPECESVLEFVRFAYSATSAIDAYGTVFSNDYGDAEYYYCPECGAEFGKDNPFDPPAPA